MQLLLDRSQSKGRVLNVTFKLWAKFELNEEEDMLTRKYSMRDAVLVNSLNEGVIKWSAIWASLTWLVMTIILSFANNTTHSVFVALLIGIGVGYWYYHTKRETLFVSDLLSGRFFYCNSVTELVEKEAWIRLLSQHYRQVLETAKNWGDNEAIDIQPLTEDDFRQIKGRGL